MSSILSEGRVIDEGRARACRVALFIQSFSGGGAERVMVTLANQLGCEGVDVTMLVVSETGPLRAELAANVKIVNFNKKRAVCALLPLKRYLERVSPDVIMSTVDNINFVLALASKLSGFSGKTFARLANAPSKIGERGTGVELIVSRVIGPVFLQSLKWFDGLVAVSGGVASEVGALLPDLKVPATVIYSPSVSDQMFELADHALGKMEVVFERSRVILAVGRLAPQKDFATLIRAFAEVEKSQNVTLVILGEGAERAGLEALVKALHLKGRVFMPGFDPNPYKYMRKASVFVLSSRFEGLPNVLIQAQALGVPVVSTNCKHGPREILGEGEFGLLVPVGDVNGLAEAITHQLIAPLPKVPPQLLEKYSVVSVVNRYREVLCSI